MRTTSIRGADSREKSASQPRSARLLSDTQEEGWQGKHVCLFACCCCFFLLHRVRAIQTLFRGGREQKLHPINRKKKKTETSDGSIPELPERHRLLSTLGFTSATSRSSALAQRSPARVRRDCGSSKFALTCSIFAAKKKILSVASRGFLSHCRVRWV